MLLRPKDNARNAALGIPVQGGILNANVLALLRCLVAVSLLLNLQAPSTEAGWLAVLVNTSIVMYTIYSVLVVAVSYQRNWQVPHWALCWVDLTCYTWLLVLMPASGENLYQCFFYPIFIASFIKGLREGLMVTTIAFALLLGSGVVAIATGNLIFFGQNGTLICGVYLLVVGNIIAHCGGYGGLLTRKLELLKEVNSHWHPRVGIDQIYSENLHRLLEFFNGSMCILVLRREGPNPSYAMYAAYREKPLAPSIQQDIAESAAKELLNRLPDTLAAHYRDMTESVWWWQHQHYTFDIFSGIKSKSFEDKCAALANLLDAKVFATVPYIQHGSTTGRIFLTRNRSSFTNSDLDFLSQTSNVISSVVEGMQLVEELISKAAEQERSSISRDLHDTTIQPYIGLKLGLEALSREATQDSPLSRRIYELIEMAEMTVADLRDFAATIKGKGAMPSEAMIAAIKTQADRLHRFYGINVQISSNLSNKLKGRLAAEVFQIVSEGLSNILRHTKAKNANISVSCDEMVVDIEICNDEGDGKAFLPRSISERARSLNGATRVESRSSHRTAVVVTIPL